MPSPVKTDRQILALLRAVPCRDIHPLDPQTRELLRTAYVGKSEKVPTSDDAYWNISSSPAHAQKTGIR
jgi:hypothetical protein